MGIMETLISNPQKHMNALELITATKQNDFKAHYSALDKFSQGGGLKKNYILMSTFLMGKTVSSVGVLTLF